jgi:flagellar biosynthesis protein FlhF
MQVKRFQAPSMQEAIQRVKEELGPEAIILKSEVINRGGVFGLAKKDMVEVTAAVEVPLTQPEPVQAGGGRLGYFTPRSKDDPAAGGRAFAKMLVEKITDEKPASGKKPSKASAPKPAASPVKPPVPTAVPTRREPNREIESLQNQLDDLRNAIKHMAQRIDPSELKMKEFADLPAPLAHAMMSLVESGVEGHIARSLIEKAASSISVDHFHDKTVLYETLVQETAKWFRVAGPIACVKGKARVIVLVGPTGVGKTTTLSKLAANSKFQFHKQVALISADTYRMSAVEHLNTFAGIAQLPIIAVYSPSELKTALDAYKDKDLIFIDTAGRNPKDAKHLAELKEFMEAARPDEIHLVLSANMKNMDLLDTIRRFRTLPFNRIVVSKLDETGSPGGLLTVAAEANCPLSYITLGQTIPDDIELANPERLARTIIQSR